MENRVVSGGNGDIFHGQLGSNRLVSLTLQNISGLS